MNEEKRKVRFAVVGLGHIAQVAVLPAFKHANETCELTAFITSDTEKLCELSKRYKVDHTFTYEQYDEALASDTFDAVYIALPNDMHKDFAIRAANARKHILCEKPMAMNEEECLAMIEAAEFNKVKLMVAYRLHFEPTNMKVVEMLEHGMIGQPRIFNSSFTMQVREGNIRTQSERGGGPLNDIGIYCINAARYVFQEEPLEVTAIMAQCSDPRFAEIEEAVGAIMKFADEKLATFVCSFGSSDVSRYEVIGTTGHISVEPAYDYVEELGFHLVCGQHQEKYKAAKHDQFAPELIHFAECILNGKEPRPSGYEGLADISVIEAIKRSARSGKTEKVNSKKVAGGTSKPNIDLVNVKPAVQKPQLVNVESGSK
ncbi:MAG: Gfo/Idh/MocA family oxidoreductase [Cyanobacteria bacterium TGS_CYA1]|nr:Gfo/Idh/MocA family oxidoreductase [Cyanobacteria bacterium TGS_CYA1]